MTENKNEIVEVAENMVSVLQRETNDYVILKDGDGKFVRKAKYKDYSSFTAQSREDKIWLLNVLEASDDAGTGLKTLVGKTIEVEHIMLRSYDKVNEDTGEMEYGVLTYLINPEKEVYVTSSKNVYFSITRILELFGTPDSPEWENIKLLVQKEKMQNGDMIKVKMVG